jgi:hypothetical protein
MEHLVKYYVQARPIGWWGPVKREAQKLGLLAHVVNNNGGNK